MSRTGVLESVVQAIGRTPLVALDRASSDCDGRILAKLEYLNPGYSKKDRFARQIIEDAERDGLLSRGSTVVELTSGNTGTGLAIVCAVKGYPFVAVMSRGNSIERARMMQALGAEVVLVDQAPGSTPGEVSGEDLQLVEVAADRITAERQAFRADQFHSQSNLTAHYRHTGPEILEQTNGKFDAFCDFVGTGGTFAGCARAFKEADRNIGCYVVEPEGSAVLAAEGTRYRSHPIQGGGYGRELPLLDRHLVDGYLSVSGAEASAASRLLARTEGIFAGVSTGANFAAARRLLSQRIPGATVVILACDSGLKYLSTELWREA